MAKLNKKEFVQVINRIKKIMDFENEVNDVFDKYWCEAPTFVDSIDVMVHTLNVMFDQFETDAYGSDIDYFIFELKFGENPHGFKMTDKNGNKIDLSSAEKLYDYITRDDK